MLNSKAVLSPFSMQLPNGVQSPPGLKPRLLDPSIEKVADCLTQDSSEFHLHFPQLCTMIYLYTSSKLPCMSWLFLSSGKFKIVKLLILFLKYS